MASSPSSSINAVASRLQRGSFLDTFVATVVILCVLPSTMTTTTGKAAAVPVKEDVISQTMMAAESPQQERHKRALTRTACAIPSNLHDMFEELNRDRSRITFFQSTINGQAISTTMDGRGPHRVRFLPNPDQNTTCPNEVSRDVRLPLAQRTLCPYFFDILQLPTGFYPPTLSWAKCKCHDCLGRVTAGGHYGFVCEQVLTPTVVLKPAGCYQGMQKYEEKIVSVSSGCVCAFRAYMSGLSISY